MNNEKKLYTKGWVFFGSFLGGPLAGCYLVSKNFETLGQKNLAKKTLIVGIITTIILFGSILFIPEAVLSKIPSSVIPLVYTMAIYQYLVFKQGAAIEEHLKNGGLKHSGWKVAGIGLLSLVISMLYAFALAFLLPESLMS
jgi:MFS superfamily sulfate permease-like transporter